MFCLLFFFLLPPLNSTFDPVWPVRNGLRQKGLSFFSAKRRGGLLSDHLAVYSSVSRVPLFFPYSLATWFFCSVFLLQGINTTIWSRSIRSRFSDSYLLAINLCLNFRAPPGCLRPGFIQTRRGSRKMPLFFSFFLSPPPTFLFFVICTSVVQIRGSGLFNLVSHLYTRTQC